MVVVPVVVILVEVPMDVVDGQHIAYTTMCVEHNNVVPISHCQ